ncbi:MAG: hypothetical protein IT373_38045 [Polyangiaceae bacterium]|nr:hypothetical protein [Polyangiaceae bacterium]
MKLKMVVVDLELSRRQKRILGVGLAAAVVMGRGAAALAAVPHTFAPNETLRRQI